MLFFGKMGECFFHNLYSPTRAKQDRDVLAYTTDLVRATFIVASSHGNDPVGSNFDIDPSLSDVLEQVRDPLVWTEVLPAFSHLPNKAHRIHCGVSTCFPTHASWATLVGGTRLDMFFANACAMRIISDSWVTPIRVTKGHLPLNIQFDVPSLLTKGRL